MALFGEGGQYEGLEGWYDVLRAAQDGDTVTATNDLAGTSLTGAFMRSAQGKIQIDMDEQGGTAPESLFAHFGGVIVRGDPKVAQYVAGIGTYELRGQSYVWRRAIVGGQRQRDMSSCYNVDCVAATFDMIGMVGSGIQIASPLCTGFVAACTGTGRTISWIATGAGLVWTGYSAWTGNATAVDMSVNLATATIGVTNKDPVVGIGAGIAQWIWDTEISPHQR